MSKRVPAGQPASFPKASLFTLDVEALEKRQLFSDLGINVNNFNATTYPAVVKMLRESGTTDIRLWYGFDSYQERSPQHMARYVRMFHKDGFDVTLSVNPRKGRHGSADDTRGLFNYLVSDEAGLRGSVDRWEVGNEMESQHYWRGTLSDYVTDYLAPASAVLHRVGQKVVSAGVAWNPEDVKRLVNAGMLQYVDYVGYHCYRPSVGALKSAIAQVKEYAGGKPLVASEWNIRRAPDKSAWAKGVADFWPIIRDNFAYSHYFAAVVQDSQAGPAGVLTESGKPNQPFYRTYFGLEAADNTDDGDDDQNDDDKSDDDTDEDDTDHGDDDSDNEESDDDDKDDGDDNGGTKTDTDDDDGVTPTKPAKPAKPKPVKTTKPTPTTPAKPAPAPVVVPPPAPPVITGMSLLDATRDRRIKPYAVLGGVTTVDLASTGTTFLSVLASGNKKTGSVKFTIGGNVVVDSDGGYTLFGEKGADLLGATFEANKTYTVTVQPFTGPGATGTAGAISSFAIVTIDSAHPVNRYDAVAAARQAELLRAAAAERAARLARQTPTRLPGL